MKEKLTIIVTLYKMEDYLEKCMASLLNQTRKDFRIIFVDDGSPDRSGPMADDYAEKYDFIDVVHQDNMGLAGAWNTGIRNVQTEWLSFVDADDWVEADYVESLYWGFEGGGKNSNVLLFDYYKETKNASTAAQFAEQSGILSGEQFSELKKAIFFHVDRNRPHGFYEAAVAWGKAYRTSYLRSNDIFFTPEARKGQDRVFNSEAISRSGGVYYICKPLYHYLVREGSRTNRFDKNVPHLVTIELRAEKKIIEQYHLEEEVGEVFKCYVSTRLYSCMRLCYFNKNNEDPYRVRVAELEELTKTEPFKSSLAGVDMKLLDKQERLFVYCIKHKLYWLCSCLVKLKNWKTARTLT